MLYWCLSSFKGCYIFPLHTCLRYYMLNRSVPNLQEVLHAIRECSQFSQRDISSPLLPLWRIACGHISSPLLPLWSIVWDDISSPLLPLWSIAWWYIVPVATYVKHCIGPKIVPVVTSLKHCMGPCYLSFLGYFGYYWFAIRLVFDPICHFFEKLYDSMSAVT